MKVLDSNFFIVISQSDSSDKKKHYTKATLVNSTELSENIEKVMDVELLYGDVDFY